MNKLDQMIEEALRNQDRAILEATKEQGWFALRYSQFRGKLGWITWVIVLIQVVFLIAVVWCAVRFFRATEILPALQWGISGAVLLIMSIQLKLILIPQMQAGRILHELKRVELILASEGVKKPEQ